jgi:hypothetical protein
MALRGILGFFRCTLPPGHDGADHVQMSNEVECARWPRGTGAASVQDLIEASSLGSPEAKALRTEGHRIARGER